MFALALEAVAMGAVAYNDRLPRHVVRYVEGELTYYSIHKDMVMDYIRQRDAILQQGRQWPELDVMPDGGEMTDPTFATTMRLMMMEGRVRKAMHSINCIDSVLKNISDEERRFVRRKYFDSDRLSANMLAEELGMSRAAFFRMQDEVIRKFAVRFGLI